MRFMFYATRVTFGCGTPRILCVYMQRWLRNSLCQIAPIIRCHIAETLASIKITPLTNGNGHTTTKTTAAMNGHANGAVGVGGGGGAGPKSASVTVPAAASTTSAGTMVFINHMRTMHPSHHHHHHHPYAPPPQPPTASTAPQHCKTPLLLGGGGGGGGTNKPPNSRSFSALVADLSQFVGNATHRLATTATRATRRHNDYGLL